MQFHLGVLAKELLGIMHTVFGNELGKGAVTLALDAVGYGRDADSQLDCDVRQAKA